MKKQNFIEDNLVILSKQTLDVFLKQDRPADLVALYTFYYYTAKWQETDQPYCTTNYVANGLRWGEDRVRTTKAKLVGFGLIQDVTEKDPKTKKIIGNYIKLNYMWKKETLQKASLRESGSAECVGSNALSANKKNALSVNRSPVGTKSSNDTTTSNTTKQYDKDGWPYLLSELLLTLILENKPNFYESKLKQKGGREKWLQRWAYDTDLMIRVDKIEPERIMKVIEWCQADPFWQKNILSTSKLRSQFQNLEMKIVELPKIEKVKDEMPKDENLEITSLLIKRYGKKFLHLPDFVADKNQLHNFIDASKRIKTFSDKTKITIEHVIDYLFDCLKANYTNKSLPVFSGHLQSKHTWEVLLTQYLGELGVLWNQK